MQLPQSLLLALAVIPAIQHAFAAPVANPGGVESYSTYGKYDIKVEDYQTYNPPAGGYQTYDPPAGGYESYKKREPEAAPAPGVDSYSEYGSYKVHFC